MIKDKSFIKSPFRPGMSATVDIQTETVKDVLTVPIQAVTTRSDTSGVEEEKDEESEEEDEAVTNEDEELLEIVFVYKDEKAVMQTVKTGIQDNMYIEIIEGLENEQEIIVGPYRAVSKKLKNRDEVKKVDKKDLFKKD